MAIGDALAMPAAGLSPDEINDRYGKITGYRDRLSPEGETELEASQYGPDVELAICLAEGLATSNGFVDPILIGARFLQVASGPQRDLLSSGTLAALAQADQTDDFQAGLCEDREPGPLVRAVPIALVHALSDLAPEMLVREVMRATLITHSHPDVVNGALAVAYAVRLALRREMPPEMIAGEVLAFIDEDCVAGQVRKAKNRLEAGKLTVAEVVPELLSGEPLADTVAISLYLFGAIPDGIERLVLEAANLGDDVWYVGAIVGALAGAYHGGNRLSSDLVEGLEGRMYIMMAAPTLLRVAQLRAGIFLHLSES